MARRMRSNNTQYPLQIINNILHSKEIVNNIVSINEFIPIGDIINSINNTNNAKLSQRQAGDEYSSPVIYLCIFHSIITENLNRILCLILISASQSSTHWKLFKCQCKLDRNGYILYPLLLI